MSTPVNNNSDKNISTLWKVTPTSEDIGTIKETPLEKQEGAMLAHEGTEGHSVSLTPLPDSNSTSPVAKAALPQTPAIDNTAPLTLTHTPIAVPKKAAQLFQIPSPIMEQKAQAQSEIFKEIRMNDGRTAIVGFKSPTNEKPVTSNDHAVNNVTVINDAQLNMLEEYINLIHSEGEIVDVHLVNTGTKKGFPELSSISYREAPNRPIVTDTIPLQDKNGTQHEVSISYKGKPIPANLLQMAIKNILPEFPAGKVDEEVIKKINDRIATITLSDAREMTSMTVHTNESTSTESTPKIIEQESKVVNQDEKPNKAHETTQATNHVQVNQPTIAKTVLSSLKAQSVDTVRSFYEFAKALIKEFPDVKMFILNTPLIRNVYIKNSLKDLNSKVKLFESREINNLTKILANSANCEEFINNSEQWVQLFNAIGNGNIPDYRDAKDAICKSIDPKLKNILDAGENKLKDFSIHYTKHEDLLINLGKGLNETQVNQARNTFRNEILKEDNMKKMDAFLEFLEPDNFDVRKMDFEFKKVDGLLAKELLTQIKRNM